MLKRLLTRKKALSEGEQILQCVWSKDDKRLQEVLQSISKAEIPVAVNTRDACGRTPLHFAVLAHHMPSVLMLLKHGADLNISSHEIPKTVYGTPLHMAIQMRYLDVAEVLLTHGANPLLCSPIGRTCLEDALSQGVAFEMMVLSALDKLVKQGQVWQADMLMKNKEGKLQVHRVLVIRITREDNPCVQSPTVMQMWVYCGGELKARAWLDGSMVEFLSRTDARLGLLPGRVPMHCDGLLLEDKGGRKCFTLRATSGKHEVLEQLRQIVDTGQVLSVTHAANPGAHKPPSPTPGTSRSAPSGYYAGGCVIAPHGFKHTTTCVVCRETDVPLIIGLAHGESVHCCLCLDCHSRARYEVGESCPMCRQNISSVYHVGTVASSPSHKTGATQHLAANPTM